MDRQVILDVRSADSPLTGDLLWFLNEWCRENGLDGPRVSFGPGSSFKVTVARFDDDPVVDDPVAAVEA